MGRLFTSESRYLYRVRALACLATALLVMIGAVRLWPVPQEPETPELAFRSRAQEVIEIEEILPTTQTAGRPAPPVPPVPVVVPDDVVLEDIELDFSDANLLPLEPPPEATPGERVGDDPTTGSAPSAPVDVGPRTVRFVEPEYTREARRRNVRAELVVEVLVDERGRVLESRVVERFLLDEKGTEKQPVARLGYGLEEAALAAADRWIFRPARQNGQPVQAYTTLTFTFGV